MAHKFPIAIAASVLSLSAFAAAEAAIGVPDAGSRFTYKCEYAGGFSFSQEYTITGRSGDNLQVEVKDNRGSHRYEKPYYLTGTTMVRKSEKGGKKSLMRGDLEDFKGLESLNVGWRETGWVNESRPGSFGQLNWHYTVSVPGKEFVYNAVVGDVEVFIIEEDRWVDTYSSSLYTHYYPRIQFPVYWQYKDSNLADVQCTLTAFSGGSPQKRPQRTQTPIAAVPRTPEYKPAAVRAATPAPQPQAVQPQTVQPVRQQTAALQTAPLRAQPPQPAAVQQPRPNASGDRTEILARLHAQGLITDEEYQNKIARLQKPTPQSDVGPALAALNQKFRSREISAENFIQERTRLIARINGRTMSPEAALRVAKSLLDKKLISKIEYSRKRQEILEDL